MTSLNDEVGRLNDPSGLFNPFRTSVVVVLMAISACRFTMGMCRCLTSGFYLAEFITSGTSASRLLMDIAI